MSKPQTNGARMPSDVPGDLSVSTVSLKPAACLPGPRFRLARSAGAIRAPSFLLLGDIDTWQLIINTLTTIIASC